MEHSWGVAGRTWGIAGRSWDVAEAREEKRREEKRREEKRKRERFGLGFLLFLFNIF